MSGQILHQTEDWTIVGKVITFLTSPVDGTAYFVFYSYLDAAGKHTHTLDTKSAWTDSTMTLSQTPAGGDMRVYRKNVFGARSWWVYGNPNDKSGRLMSHNVDGSMLDWLTVPLTGFVDTATEQVTKIVAHPTANFPVYFATKDEEGGAAAMRLYRWNGVGATVTLVHSIAPGASDNRHITDIYVEQANPLSVWFTVGGTGALGPLAMYGLYHASDGVTFAKVHDGWQAGANPNNVYGALQVVVKEAAPRRIWVLHQFIDLPGPGSVSDLDYSDDEGVTFTQLTNCAWVSDSHTNWHMSAFPYGTDAVLIAILGRDTALFPVNNAWENRWTRATGVLDQTRPLTDDPTIGGGYSGGVVNGGKIVYLESDSAAGGNGTLWDSAGFGLGWGAASPAGEWVVAGATGALKEHFGTGTISFHGDKPWIVGVRNADSATARLSIDGGVTWQDIVLPGPGRCVGFVELS